MALPIPSVSPTAANLGPPTVPHRQSDTATRSMSSSLCLLLVGWRFGDQARSSILARNMWSHTLSGPATAGCLVEIFWDSLLLP